MKEHPVLFSGPMVRAILAERKTQTRRLVRDDCQGYQKLYFDEQGILRQGGMQEQAWTKGSRWVRCPYGAVGDRLWVRETFRQADASIEVHYRADLDEPDAPGCWRPSIFMPRWASRITLEVTGVRVERLQEISEEDAKAEGMEFHDGRGIGHSGFRHDRNHGWVYETAREAFGVAWDKINGDRLPWESNPWVWVLEFRRIAP